jgi:hypothetical protein
MKVLFQGKKSFQKSLGIALLCIVLSAPAYSQSQEQGGPDNHKFLYGIHLGFTDNQFDLYSTNGGLIAIQNDPSSMDDRSYHARGFRFAVIGEARLGRCFSLRVMPGVSLFRALKLESVRGEVPVDVKFHPYRWGKVEPYLTSGLGYGYDFASSREDSHNYIKPLNAHDLRYTCGLGVDWYTRYVKLGLELKAGFGLLPPNTSGINSNSLSYFHNGATFCLGLIIEG